MKRSISMLLIIAGIAIGTTASATDTDSDSSKPDRAAFEAALDACAESVSTDSTGNPDPTSMDECMTAKGFSRPTGGPPPGGGQGDDASGQAGGGPGGHRQPPPPPPAQ